MSQITNTFSKYNHLQKEGDFYTMNPNLLREEIDQALDSGIPFSTRPYCWHQERAGNCRLGPECNFSHSIIDFMARQIFHNPYYKRDLCEDNNCQGAFTCISVHPPDDLYDLYTKSRWDYEQWLLVLKVANLFNIVRPPVVRHPFVSQQLRMTPLPPNTSRMRYPELEANQEEAMHLLGSELLEALGFENAPPSGQSKKTGSLQQLINADTFAPFPNLKEQIKWARRNPEATKNQVQKFGSLFETCKRDGVLPKSFKKFICLHVKEDRQCPLGEKCCYAHSFFTALMQGTAWPNGQYFTGRIDDEIGQRMHSGLIRIIDLDKSHPAFPTLETQQAAADRRDPLFISLIQEIFYISKQPGFQTPRTGWKTQLCNKVENSNGQCEFERKCRYAHTLFTKFAMLGIYPDGTAVGFYY